MFPLIRQNILRIQVIDKIWEWLYGKENYFIKVQNFMISLYQKKKAVQFFKGYCFLFLQVMISCLKIRCEDWSPITTWKILKSAVFCLLGAISLHTQIAASCEWDLLRVSFTPRGPKLPFLSNEVIVAQPECKLLRGQMKRLGILLLMSY